MFEQLSSLKTNFVSESIQLLFNELFNGQFKFKTVVSLFHSFMGLTV